MIGSVTAVRVNHSRNIDKKIVAKSLPVTRLIHVLGVCRQGELLRYNRHNKIVRIIANALREGKWIFFKEFSCLSVDGSSRRM